jgi:Rieske Fe-S protein
MRDPSIENDPTTTQPAPGSSTIDELNPFSRRRALQGVAGIGILGIAGTVLSACGSDEPASTTPSETQQPASSDEPTAGDTTAAASAPAGDAIATTDEVPVGGGLILENPEKIVITQPEDGDFKAFTAVCTHQGCTVGSVENNVIRCPCHGSQYDASTGEVIQGPAPKALAPIDISVEGDDILLLA